MKKYFIPLIILLNLSFYSLFSLPSKVTCNCFQSPNSFIKSYSREYNRFGLSVTDPKSYAYPYYLINLSLVNNKVQNPIYYFECYNNFNIYNDTLFNCLNYKLKCYSIYPEGFKNERATNPKEFYEQYDRSIKKNYRTNEIIKEAFRRLYHACYKAGHNNPLTVYDHGFLAFTEGNPEEAMNCAVKYINILKDEKLEDQIQPQELLLLGQSYLELNEYSKAIEVLSDLIQKDPTNQEAYLNRSFAYFETGSFEEALLDFNLSNKEKSLTPAQNEASSDFTQALLSSLYDASREATLELVPSLYESAYGLSSVLWTNFLSPIESKKNFINACYEMGACVINYCKTVDQDTIDGYIDQIKIIHQHLDNLSDKEKGELFGHIIGKYGIDFFAGGVAVKGIKTFRNLKTANRICNLEAMTISISNKEAIIASSLQHAKARESYLKNLKYNFDAHNKHVLGHNDFDLKRSIWQHKDPEGLLKKFSGTGHPGRGEFGIPGFRETVDFKEHIGIWKNLEGTLQLPTTRGTIHYGKKGAHIVPSNPNPYY